MSALRKRGELLQITLYSNDGWARMKSCPLAVAAICTVLWSGEVLACPSSPSIVISLAKTAEGHFSSMSDVAFADTLSQLHELESCIDAPLSPVQVSALHRVEALAAFQAGDERAAVRALRAMLEADPSAELSVDVAPPGHHLRRLLEDGRKAIPDLRGPFAISPPCIAIIDGAEGSDRPLNLPTVIVIQNANSQVVWSGLLNPDEELDFTCPASGPTHDHGRHRARPVWLASAGMAVVAGGLWMSTALSIKQLEVAQEQISSGESPDLSADEIRRLGKRRDNLLSAAQVTSVVTAGLGVVAVGVTIRW